MPLWFCIIYLYFFQIIGIEFHPNYNQCMVLSSNGIIRFYSLPECIQIYEYKDIETENGK